FDLVGARGGLVASGNPCFILGRSGANGVHVCLLLVGEPVHALADLAEHRGSNHPGADAEPLGRALFQLVNDHAASFLPRSILSPFWYAATVSVSRDFAFAQARNRASSDPVSASSFRMVAACSAVMV